MAQEAFLKDKIEKAVGKYLVSSIWEHTSIAFAKNQNNAGMLGAFYHVSRKIVHSLELQFQRNHLFGAD